MLTAGGRTGDTELIALYAAVQGWFTVEALRERLALGDSPVEQISLEWLARAGKRWRPFLAVCMYRNFLPAGHREDLGLSEDIRNVALALECIHKGSLIYDDIQDDDDLRYGEPTVHTVHGLPLAMTASLLLIGQGYRMLAECQTDPARRVEMLRLATDGHCRLCLGQGGELAWMRQPHPLAPDEVLDIFRFKTAPSFDVVFRLPAVCAGAADAAQSALARYAEIIGTAYQIQDDLDDYHGKGDVDDIQSRRPSIVMAYAHEAATGEDKTFIAETWCGDGTALDRERLHRIIDAVGAPDRAQACLDQHRQDAIASIAGLPEQLRLLLTRVSDMIFQGL